jgi:hypothetical protein
MSLSLHASDAFWETNGLTVSEQTCMGKWSPELAAAPFKTARQNPDVHSIDQAVHACTVSWESSATITAVQLSSFLVAQAEHRQQYSRKQQDAS